MSTTTPLLPSWTLGELMEKARRDAHISTADMALHFGVTRKTINNWEANRSTPSRAVLLVWAQRCDQPWFTAEGIRDLLVLTSPWITALPGQLEFADVRLGDAVPVDDEDTPAEIAAVAVAA